jgi:positive regulator of sigma E activity
MKTETINKVSNQDGIETVDGIEIVTCSECTSYNVAGEILEAHQRGDRMVWFNTEAESVAYVKICQAQEAIEGVDAMLEEIKSALTYKEVESKRK